MGTRKAFRAGREERRRCLLALRAEGIDIGDAAEFVEPDPEPCPIEISAGGHVGEIFDASPLDSGYVIPVRIVAHGRATLDDCFIEVWWDDATINLPYLKKHANFYYFGHRKYPCAEVLNEYFESHRTLNRGQFIEGVILAYGYEAIPHEIKPGPAQVTLTLVDILHREAQAQVQLPFMRYANRLRNSVINSRLGIKTARSATLPRSKHLIGVSAIQSRRRLRSGCSVPHN